MASQEPDPKKARIGIFEGLDPTIFQELYNFRMSDATADFLETVKKNVLPKGKDVPDKDKILEEWKLFVEDMEKLVASVFPDAGEERLRRWNSIPDQFTVVGAIQQYAKTRLLGLLVPQGLIYKEWDKFKKSHPWSIEDVLKSLFTDDRDSGIRRIPAKLDDGVDTEFAYYISGGSAVDFRHEGTPKNIPPKIFLSDRSSDSNDRKIHVFYSSSGSGKTVELAGSALTRKSHLAIVITPKIGDFESAGGEIDVVGQNRYDVREDETFPDLMFSLSNATVANRDAFVRLLQVATNEKQLKLVVAIDEASECPDLVRAIIHDQDKAKDSVLGIFQHYSSGGDVAGKIDVRFSVAGTGAFASTAGSLPANFARLTPYFADKHKSLRDRFLEDVRPMLVPGFGGERKLLGDYIEECLPVAAVMMENPRMASIARKVLKNHPDEAPIVESTLVETIAVKFMECNGLSDLLNRQDRRHGAAAAALAVELFQGRRSKHFPENKEEYLEKMLAMDFVLDFADDIVGNDISVKLIVSKYGLLEPTYKDEDQEWEEGKPIKKPFRMTAAQQIIALYMLDVKDMLEATPFGFETLSTHLVKCAVAASLTVKEDERPDLYTVLELIGFEVCKKGTAPAITGKWEGLKQYIAVGSTCLDKEGRDTVFRSTRQLEAELLIEKKEFASKTESKELLVIDKMLYLALTKLEAKTDQYSSPITCINYGNSPFADGFITFYVKKKEGESDPERFTIMNQSKDYHTGKWDHKKLQKHADLGDHALLDQHFGKKDFRLLCVSSSSDVVIATRITKTYENTRRFLPYCVDQSTILKDVLAMLQSQRAKKQRLYTHTFYCDVDGKIVKQNELKPDEDR